MATMSFTLGDKLDARMKGHNHHRSIVVLQLMLNMLSVPLEQWVGNCFKVHECVLGLKTKNLHLAVASRVIDDKQVHSIICISIQPCFKCTWIKQL